MMEARPWHEHYDEGVPPSLEYPSVPLTGLLDRAADDFGHRPGLVFQNATLSYAAFRDEVDRLATVLARMGVTKGDRVAIQLPNLPQAVIAFYATLRVGGIVVMTNPLYMPPEIEHQWNDAGVKVAVVLDALFAAKIAPIRDRLPVRHYLIASIPEYLRFPLNILAPLKLRRMTPPMIAPVPTGDGVHRFREVIRNARSSVPAVEIAPDDVALLQYTGGTTGVSKGAMLTHGNVLANVEQCAVWNPSLQVGEEALVCCLPLFHIYGLTVSMLLAARAGAALVLIANPRDIAAIVKAVEKHRATMCPMVPAQFLAFTQYPGVERANLSSLKVCNSGSAPLAVDVLHRFEELTGARITEGYGLSEASPVTHSNPVFGTRKPGSIGVPMPDTDIRVVDVEQGTTDVPVGEEGELIIRGPQIFPGYWNREDETALVLQDGWLHTGDLARMDADGFTYIVGRKKDMILASGYNVYPDEIDRTLMSHAKILEAASIGVPDTKRGETVKSFVVLKPGETMTAEEVMAFSRERMAAYKVPREVEFRDSLPKSTVMKILRRELRDEEMRRREAGG